MTNKTLINLRKLIPVSMLLFLILRNVSAISSEFLFDLFHVSGISFWFSFLISELFPLAAISILAYYISNQIWNKIMTGKIKFNATLIRFSVSFAIVSAISFFYPYFSETLIGPKHLTGSKSIGQMITSSYYKTGFNYLELILLIVLTSLNKSNSSNIIDQNNESVLVETILDMD